MKLSRKILNYSILVDGLSSKLLISWIVVLNTSLAQRIIRKLKFLPLALRRVSVKVKALGGKSVLIDSFDSSHFIIFSEIFAEKIYDFSVVNFTPDLIIDCGGHIGLFTLISQNEFPKTKAMVFEPNSENLSYLRSQIENNHLEVEIRPSAVSDYNGSASFDAGCSCSGSILEHAGGLNGLTLVKVVDLCQIIRENKSSKLILKMDIEGGEEKLIPLVVPMLPFETVFFFETHFGESSWLRHSEFLEQHGFKVMRTSNRERYSDGVAIRG